MILIMDTVFRSITPQSKMKSVPTFHCFLQDRQASHQSKDAFRSPMTHKNNVIGTVFLVTEKYFKRKIKSHRSYLWNFGLCFELHLGRNRLDNISFNNSCLIAVFPYARAEKIAK